MERFGTLRELTRTGFGGGGDGCVVFDPVTGDTIDDNPNDGTAPFCARS